MEFKEKEKHMIRGFNLGYEMGIKVSVEAAKNVLIKQMQSREAHTPDSFIDAIAAEIDKN